MLNQLLDSEQMQSTELALRQKDTDKLRYVQVHAQSFRDNFQLKVRLTLTDISDRVESDELLKQSEDRFRRAIMEMPEPAIIHADDGEILLVNNRWTEFSGYTQTDIPDIKTWTTKAYGDASEKIEADIKSLHSIEKRRDEGDYVIRTKDGNTRIWEFSSSPLGHLPDGRRISMSVARDVTRRRKDEQYLKEREAFINAILNTTPTLIAVWNIEPMELKFINARVKTLLGYSSDELISMGADMVHQLVHPDDIASYANHFQKFLDATPDQPVFYSQEFRAKDKQGQWHWFISIDSVLTYHEDGTPKEITGAAMDVTDLVGARNEIQALNETLEQRVEERTKELRTVNNRLVAEIQQRQEAENRLRDSEQFLQSIIDGQPSEIAVLDSSGMIVAVNEVWKEFARNNNANEATIEGVGLSYIEVVERANDEITRDLLQQVIEGDTDLLRHEYEFSNGKKEMWFEMTISRFMRGEQPYVLVSHSNITERKQLESEIQSALETEQELNQLKSRFLSMMSHEVRTPLSVILTSSSLLKNYRERLDEEKQVVQLNKIMSKVKQLN